MASAGGGNLGLIITEHCYITRQGKAKAKQLSIAEDEVIEGMRHGFNVRLSRNRNLRTLRLFGIICDNDLLIAVSRLFHLTVSLTQLGGYSSETEVLANDYSVVVIKSNS